ncbi:follistatin-A isoform X2 [Rhopalosiphum maidis]|uniref:follistatin-A isoform X2 n=1 Tax=Rhopalosiphum maidis TaxID=43146 RepID=UPI000EFF4E05|nr:follistatin-A isoform X2 [Rhopalosiphum maidis]
MKPMVEVYFFYRIFSIHTFYVECACPKQYSDDRFKNGDSCTSAEWCPQFITEHVHSMTICGVASMKSMYPVAWKPKYFLFSAILHVCSLDLVLGGMCWASMGKNGLCKDLLAERLTKEQCCKLGGSSVSTSWSPTDLDPGALFFWRVLGDGVPCAKCKGSCTDVECVPGKKCVMRSGTPKCICSPNCKQRDGFTVKGPVCGTDGVSYKSHCRLKKRSCRTRDQSLLVDYHGLCQSSCNKVTCPGGKYCLQDQNLMPHCVKCATFCPPGMSPSRLVCGSDGRTYQSACHLREAACRMGKAIPIAYKGLCKKSATCATVSCKSGQKCLVEKKTGRPRCVTCNLSCPDPETSGKRKDTSGKVCGSNDKTYHSWCQMFMDACATGVVIETKASGPCPEGETVFNGNWNYVNASNVVIDGI